MRISTVSTYTFRNRYYEYGNQKFLKEKEKKNEVKTAVVLAFGLACLGVGILTKTRAI